MPFWLRARPMNPLRWVNRAYVRAVEGDSIDRVLAFKKASRCPGFPGARGESSCTIMPREGAVPPSRSPQWWAGDRRIFQVTDFSGDQRLDRPSPSDTTELEFNVLAAGAHGPRSHADTLDQPHEAVAIFDADEKLRFFNQAFQKLWQLDANFRERA